MLPQAYGLIAELVGERYDTMPVTHITSGWSGYLDTVEERHIGLWNNAAKGFDKQGREFVTFCASCTVNGVLYEFAIFTVFQRYPDESTLVICRSHTCDLSRCALQRVLEPLVGTRVTEVGFPKLQQLFRSGEYRQNTTVVKLCCVPFCSLLQSHFSQYRESFGAFFGAARSLISGARTHTRACKEEEQDR